MLCSVITLFLVVLIMVLFHSYSRCCFGGHHRRNRNRSRPISPLHPLYSSVTPNTTTFTQGLDPSILKALPTFTYSSKTHDSPLECAVCFSEFENDEQGRVLPRCEHAFHVECIDSWFLSVSNCPICRTPVQTDVSVVTADISVDTEVEPAGLQTEPGQTEETETCYSGYSHPVSLEPSDCRRKPLELMGVVVG